MPDTLRLVFAGTPEFAVPHLAACRRDNVELVAVYTQPDRPAGRGRALAASPVKQAALAANLRVEQPENFRAPGALDRHGQPLNFEADGLLAVCIQHEMDHLVGKLFVDYLSPLKREMVRRKLEKQRRTAAQG